MRNINLDLSNDSIDNLINKLKQFKKDIKNDIEETIEETTLSGVNEIEYNYAETKYKDGNNDYQPYEFADKNYGEVGVYGSQVFYNEFGTGTEGMLSSHPTKGKYNLNDYNSGKNIKKSSKHNGELGWYYKSKSGKIVWTKGIPAGMQVYKTSLKLKKEFPKRLKQKVGESLLKV